jgi:hypothetical protein
MNYIYELYMVNNTACITVALLAPRVIASDCGHPAISLISQFVVAYSGHQTASRDVGLFSANTEWLSRRLGLRGAAISDRATSGSTKGRKCFQFCLASLPASFGEHDSHVSRFK